MNEGVIIFISILVFFLVLFAIQTWGDVQKEKARRTIFGPLKPAPKDEENG